MGERRQDVNKLCEDVAVSRALLEKMDGILASLQKAMEALGQRVSELEGWRRCVRSGGRGFFSPSLPYGRDGVAVSREMSVRNAALHRRS